MQLLIDNSQLSVDNIQLSETISNCLADNSQLSKTISTYSTDNMQYIINEKIQWYKYALGCAMVDSISEMSIRRVKRYHFICDNKSQYLYILDNSYMFHTIEEVNLPINDSYTVYILFCNEFIIVFSNYISKVYLELLSEDRTIRWVNQYINNKDDLSVLKEYIDNEAYNECESIYSFMKLFIGN